MDKEALKALLREILTEEAGGCPVKLARVPQIVLTENDRLDTGDGTHRVYTHDLFSLKDSPRMGCGIMEMKQTAFPWTLEYDEIDYVISGSLTVRIGDHAVTAKQGEVILIPKGSSIVFAAPEQARFLYVTDPADWQHAGQ